MIRLKKISLHQINDMIKLSYHNDTDLFEKYHLPLLMPIKEEDAAKVTFEMIKDASKMKQLCNYKVLYNNLPIGYVTTFDNNFLYSYAINPKYRKKDILIDWWEKVKDELDDKFQTVIYANNERAIGFLLKQKMQILSRKNDVITFVNN